MCQNKRYLPGATMVLGHLELMVGVREQHFTVCVHPLPSRHLNVSQVVAAHLSEEEKHASTVAWNAR